MEIIKIFDKKIQIGGYSLPADFVYLDSAYIKSLSGLEYHLRIKDVYEKFTNKKCNQSFIEKLNDEDFLNLYSFDDNFCCLDLANLDNLDYTDYVFCRDNLYDKIASIIAVITSSYVEIVLSDLITFNDKINVILPCDDGLTLLALKIAKKVGVQIDVIIAGTSKNCDYIDKYTYISKIDDNEIDDLISDYFLEYDLLLDLKTAYGVMAYEDYYDKYSNDNLCLLLAVSSPYLFSRRVYKAITGKIELDVKKAITKVYEESSLEIPSSVLNEAIPPHYIERENLPLEIAIRFIKSII